MYTKANVNIQVKITNIQIGSEERYCLEDKMYAKQNKANRFMEIYKKKNPFCTSKYSQNISPASKISLLQRNSMYFLCLEKVKSNSVFHFSVTTLSCNCPSIVSAWSGDIETESIDSKAFHLHIHK